MIAMIDVRLPDTKTLKTLWEKIGNVPCIKSLSALPLQMGTIIYTIDVKPKCMCDPLTAVYQEASS